MLGRPGIGRKRCRVQQPTQIRGLRLPERNRLRPARRKAATEMQTEIRGSKRGPGIGVHLGVEIWPRTPATP